MSNTTINPGGINTNNVPSGLALGQEGGGERGVVGLLLVLNFRLGWYQCKNQPVGRGGASIKKQSTRLDDEEEKTKFTCSFISSNAETIAAIERRWKR